MSKHMEMALQWRVQIFQYEHDRSDQPKLQRTAAESDKIRRRNELRRKVAITRLRQQGLTRYEAETQYEDRLYSYRGLK